MVAGNDAALAQLRGVEFADVLRRAEAELYLR